MKNPKYIFIFILAVLGLASCDLAGLDEPGNIQGNQTSSVFTLQAQSDKLREQIVSTKAADPKSEAEKEIRSMHIFFFGADGEYVKPKAGYEFPAYVYTESNIYGLPQGATDEKNATIYVVANVENGTFDKDNLPENLEALENFVYSPREMTLSLPSSGMPMVGKLESLDITAPRGNATIELKALMARVDFTISLNSQVEENGLPALVLKGYKVGNIPTKVPLKAISGETVTVDEAGNSCLVTLENKANNQYISNKKGSISATFYVFENIQEKNGKYTYPEGENGEALADDMKQRFKPLIAKDNAMYVEFDTNFLTYNTDASGQSLTFDVDYKLYLGANHTDDFKVRRNHQYKNNIVISGLTATGTGVEDRYTYDARVNVEESNPFYLAILREREHDCHFCVTPMDAYIFEEGAYMKVSIPEDVNWVGMEKIDAAKMAAGESQNDNCWASKKAWCARNSIRKYFTKDLVTSLNNNARTVTLTNRDRIYFYLDENLSTSLTRTARVKCEYFAPGSSEASKIVYINLVQVPFIEIHFTDKYHSGDNKDYSYYMEQFEEYLDYYDPLEEYNTENIYQGLPWGCKDISTGATLNNYHDGLDATNTIVSKAEQTKLALNENPHSAAEYCYNRNYRDGSGSAASKKWFLPGIRQMEFALTEFYSKYPEFQQYYYWSSAPAKYKGLVFEHENIERARATRILDGKYAESGAQYDGSNDYEKGQGGRAKRTELLRIRAFRTDLKK